MSRFRIGVGLLLVLLGLCIWAQARMSAIQKPIAQQITQAEALASREDWPQATAKAAQARTQWEEHRTFLAALADHQPLEDIESLFATLDAYSEAQDETEFRAACQELSRRILAVKEAQEFSMSSLF